TKIYVKEFKANKNDIKALAHITGGGLVENLPRVLPGGLGAVVQKSSIKTLPVFDFMAEHVEESEMYRTFNMGVGMVWVVSKENADKVAANVGGYIIGELVKGDKEVRLA
ncbi:MAG TPA: AIR synthase-related protein, partial [Campylobacterales bacterium]|nr:AIR synthase-related protein [Campylobacterales bacterium]